MSQAGEKTTHFGFQDIPEQEKTSRVREVFRSVAPSYDLMNDLMSGGLHRLWKRFAVDIAQPRPGEQILDVASGSGDMALHFARAVGPTGRVLQTDINEAMLKVGRERLLNAGYVLPALLCDAEKLPFDSGWFDLVTVSFGLRNMTHKDQALAEMARVLKPGGRLMVLEFSKVHRSLEKAYDIYSFNVLPKLGKWVARDEPSYQYLAESIRMHPDQETLKAMMADAGLERIEYFNLTGGIVAVHKGIKP
ncbi:MAG TPA: bifunctional demethylmenaquinone methyltransferase/2-methoxy-6-polyprenyl-1,4-benzoquinol methylase UbiE [Usitatibacteraceae bacterium]|nr:bifunctional demethylmenaquinone methyltransferase/2-methoxy-6-polyprenyl-1,4-benzoquinol methylase UbiE [Usitatibacteraceae bacterium]